MHPPPQPVQDGLPTPARYYAMVVILLGIAISVLDSTIVNLALPSIARDLHSTPAETIWVVNAYQLGVLMLLLPCAALGDLVGYRRVYLWGLCVLLLGSVGCVLADSLPVLILSRAVQGVGSAGVMGVNSALVRLTYPRALLGRGIAINSVTVAVASVAGPSIAALILSVAQWPWLFAINLPLAAGLFLLGLRALPRNNTAPAPGARLSKIDVLLNAAMFALVFLGVDALGTRAAASAGATTAGFATAFALLGAGCAVGVVYVRRQLKQPLPLLPVDLLGIRVFALSMCTSVGAFAAQMLSNIALPFLLLEGLHLSHAQTGLLISAWPLGTVLTAPVAGRLIGRVPAGLLSAAGLWTMGTGLVLLALLPEAPQHWDIAWRMVLCGIGFGLFQSPNNFTIVTSAPAHRAGGASGALGTARQLGQSLGAVLIAIVFSIANPHDGHGPLIALVIAAVFSFVAGVFSALRARDQR